MPVERRLVVSEGARVREVLLVGTVTVGRSPSCEISSADPRLSRAHASFEVEGSDVVVRDLESRNGTRVNGQKASAHRLTPGDVVEVGPFSIRLVESGAPAPAAPATGNDDATVVRRPDALPATPAAAPAAAAPDGGSDDATRVLPRRPVPASGPAAAEPAAPAAVAAAPAAPARPGAPAAPPQAPPPPETARALPFARSALLWVVPVALVAFLAGLVPDLLQPDERAPLLNAHYEALAAGAVELVRLAGEPATPLDAVTTALRRQTGVVSARIIAGDGRVLAPLAEQGTSVAAPTLSGAAPDIADDGAGRVTVRVAAASRDARAVVVELGVDPAAIHPPPVGSPMATVLLVVCLAAAWLVARRVATDADQRLSRLGEEVELMTTGQIAAGREPFGLRGGQRVLDAVTFALSPAGRRTGASAGEGETPPARRVDRFATQDGPAPTAATIAADAGFRITDADAGCQALLGLAPDSARGMHLIDALKDQAVADETLRLVTLATPGQRAEGEATPAGGAFRLRIGVERRSGAPALTIHFERT